MTEDAVQREFAYNQGIFHGFEGQAPAQDNDAQCDGQIVGRAFFTNRSRGQIDNNAMSGKMQASVLDGGLYAFTAFLYSGIR